MLFKDADCSSDSGEAAGLGAGWLRLFNLAATEGFAVFGVRAAVFGVDGGATAAGLCGDKKVAVARGGMSEK